MPNKIVMKNGRGSSTRGRSTSTGTRKSSSSLSGRGRRNGVTPAGTMSLSLARQIVAKNGAKTVKANPSKRGGSRNSRKPRGGGRRNGITSIFRNGIFGSQSLMQVGKTVALGGIGAVAAGVIGRSVMSLGGNRISGMGVQPFVIQGAVEALASVTIIQMVADKVLGARNGGQNNNAAMVMTGGLIKSALTIIDGLLPDVNNFNPFAHNQLPAGNVGSGAIEGVYSDMNDNNVNDYTETVDELDFV